MDKTDFSNFDSKVIDVDEVVGSDVKINPDVYIHNAILKVQAALVKDDVQTGLLQAVIMVNHIEGLCRASNRLSSDYAKKVDDFKKHKDFTSIDDERVKKARLCDKKLELLLGEVFANTVSTDPIKM